MKRNNDTRQPTLPSISSFKTPSRPIKDFLKVLKDRKLEI